MNRFDTQIDGRENAGRKGIAYDWQRLLAADGLVEIEAALTLYTAEALELAE